MILRHVMGAGWQERAIGGETLPAEQEAQSLGLVERRVAGEPLAYVLGDAAFGELELRVGPGVLIPRVETELLVEAAVDIAKNDFSKLTRVDALDLGTGTANIALGLAAAEPRIHVDAVENSSEALRYAAANVAAQTAEGRSESAHKQASGSKNEPRPSIPVRVNLIAMNYLRDAWEGNLKSLYHLILANPPYISESDWVALPSEVKREPRAALVGGPRGDEILRWIIEHACLRLAPAGAMILEVGIGQAEPLSRFAESMSGLRCDKIIPDHQGIGRILVVRKH